MSKERKRKEVSAEKESEGTRQNKRQEQESASKPEPMQQDAVALPQTLKLKDSDIIEVLRNSGAPINVGNWQLAIAYYKALKKLHDKIGTIIDKEEALNTEDLTKVIPHIKEDFKKNPHIDKSLKVSQEWQKKNTSVVTDQSSNSEDAIEIYRVLKNVYNAMKDVVVLDISDLGYYNPINEIIVLIAIASEFPVRIINISKNELDDLDKEFIKEVDTISRSNQLNRYLEKYIESGEAIPILLKDYFPNDLIKEVGGYLYEDYYKIEVLGE